jgi:hypothetical protein
MINYDLGPNGALVYCIEFLEENIEWLTDNLTKLCKNVDRCYLLFDLPGQVELYTHHKSMKNIIEKLVRLDYRLCSVNLVDSYYVTDASKFISAALISLSSMLQTELPHVNVLSKMDLIKQYGNLSFNLEFYTDVLDLRFLVDTLDSDRFLAKFKKLNERICEILQDFSLVCFLPLNIQKRLSVIRCIQQIDKASGYLFGYLDDQTIMTSISCELKIEDENEDD